MIKKVFYPFTDWNWLKIPIGAMIIAMLLGAVGLFSVGSAYFHGAHLDSMVSALGVGYFAVFSAFTILTVACCGYLIRVARQPKSEQPLSAFFPLLAVRYAHTKKFRHFFDLKWMWRAFTIAPGEYLARTAAWALLLALVTVLTPLTAGFAMVLTYALGPLSTVNCAYLVGDYYRAYLDD